MNQLSILQLLYLLYAKAYSAEGSVTKSVVKSYLPKELQKDAESTYEVLFRQKLVASPKKGRLSVTDLGEKVLVVELQSTEYRFESVKGPKVLNILLDFLKVASLDSQAFSVIEDINFETFVEKFKALYLEERKHQELNGVVAIHSRDICQKFMKYNSISQSKLKEYFDKLKSSGKVFTVTEKDDELIQWAE
jgi:FMN-dependent NADH-azoreductase